MSHNIFVEPLSRAFRVTINKEISNIIHYIKFRNKIKPNKVSQHYFLKKKKSQSALILITIPFLLQNAFETRKFFLGKLLQRFYKSAFGEDICFAILCTLLLILCSGMVACIVLV